MNSVLCAILRRDRTTLNSQYARFCPSTILKAYKEGGQYMLTSKASHKIVMQDTESNVPQPSYKSLLGTTWSIAEEVANKSQWRTTIIQHPPVSCYQCPPKAIPHLLRMTAPPLSPLSPLSLLKPGKNRGTCHTFGQKHMNRLH